MKPFDIKSMYLTLCYAFKIPLRKDFNKPDFFLTTFLLVGALVSMLTNAPTNKNVVKKKEQRVTIK